MIKINNGAFIIKAFFILKVGSLKLTALWNFAFANPTRLERRDCENERKEKDTQSITLARVLMFMKKHEKHSQPALICALHADFQHESESESRKAPKFSDAAKYTQLQIIFSTMQTHWVLSETWIPPWRERIKNPKTNTDNKKKRKQVDEKKTIFIYTRDKKHETGLKWSDKSRQRMCVRNSLMRDRDRIERITE